MSRFTTLFERLAIDVLTECDVHGGVCEDRARVDHALQLCGSKAPGSERELLDTAQALGCGSGCVLHGHARRLLMASGSWRTIVLMTRCVDGEDLR